MRTRHVTQQIERYLDRQLPLKEEARLEEHVARCPTCARRLFDARRLRTEIGPVMAAALGRPEPPPAVRRRTRRALKEAQAASQPTINWAGPGRILNTAGTLAIIVLLAAAVFGVIQGQLPETDPAHPDDASSTEDTAALKRSTPITQPRPTATPPPNRTSLGDTLPKSIPLSATEPQEGGLASPAPAIGEIVRPNRLQHETEQAGQASRNAVRPRLPGGAIAFSFFNAAPHRQLYEIHLIQPDGGGHRRFPLDGVSEPALRPVEDGYQLAYRAWGRQTTPRSLLVSNIEGYRPQPIGGFWEDAQPDWSPTEYRLIFASQRESDRRWRLYSSWGDGSTEQNLRREGRSPTFAPDGYRFAFESCDKRGNQCGLWLADLDHSEYDSRPFLLDAQARSPDWSPVGETIAYMANPSGNWDLYLVDSNGENVRQLTSDPAIDGLPTWSPNGAWLAFLSNRGGNWGIWLLHLATGKQQRVFAFDGGIFSPPADPPYGQRNWWDEQLSWSE